MLGTGEKGRYILAATFGNVHGAYKPGTVKLRPEILKQIQDEVGTKVGRDKPFDLVFHGGSGSRAGGDPRGGQLRRGEDERRHRHPVRVHPRDRRAHVHQLRRRAQGRRRGRQQEGLRPALLPASWPRPAWPSGSSRRARRCSRPGRRRDARGPRSDLGSGVGSATCSPRPPGCRRTRRRTAAAGDDPARSRHAHPASSAAWATLAEGALAGGRTVEAYAYARTGYHRGLDALRRAGWKGQGPIPWSHEPNRGFLRALHALSRAAAAIGEDDEAQRCATFLARQRPRGRRGPRRVTEPPARAGRSPRSLREQRLLDLAHRVARQRVDDANLARALVPGQLARD